MAEDHGTQYESVILNGVAVTDGCRKSLTATQRRKGAEKSRRDVVGRPSFSTTFSGPFSSRNTPISTVETWPAKCVSSAFLCAFASLRRCRRFYRIAWLSRPQESAKCSINGLDAIDRLPHLYHSSLRLCASARYFMATRLSDTPRLSAKGDRAGSPKYKYLIETV